MPGLSRWQLVEPGGEGGERDSDDGKREEERWMEDRRPVVRR